MKRSLLLILPLLLTGCSRSTNYEQSLALSPLPTPEAVLPLPSDVTAKDIETLDAMEKEIRDAKSPALALAATTQYEMGGNILKAFLPPGSQGGKWFTRSVEFYQRAGKIKAVQLEKGDAADSSGEVNRYLKFGHQSWANFITLSKSEVGKGAGFGVAATPAPRQVDVKVAGPFIEATKLAAKDDIFTGPVADPGKHFVVVKVQVTYKGPKDLRISAGDFRLRANKRIYDSHGFMATLASVDLLSAHLETGGAATGDIFFEVDKDVKSGMVEYAR